MLKKLSKAYVLLVATINSKWIDYTFADLSKTIHEISRFLKTNPLKVFHALSISNPSHFNKQPRFFSNLPLCSYPVCLSKKLYHSIDKCWERYPKLGSTYRRKKGKLLDMNIKRTASNIVKEKPSISILVDYQKFLVPAFLHSRKIYELTPQRMYMFVISKVYFLSLLKRQLLYQK